MEIEKALKSIRLDNKEIVLPIQAYHHRWIKILQRAADDFSGGIVDNDLITITGPRRSGRTTVLYFLLDHVKKNKNLDVCYVQVDRPEVRDIIEETGLDNFIDTIISRLKKRKPLVLILDEITGLGDKWVDYVKAFWDHIERTGKKS